MKLGIEGPAGTGKTLVLLIKIIYIIREKSNYDIILMAPTPHNIQCKNILEDNGVDVRFEETFPLQPTNREESSTPVVRVVDIHAFAKKCTRLKLENNRRSKEMAMLREHLFIDDMQSIFDDCEEMKETLRCLSNICDLSNTDINVWLAYDPVQGDIGLASQLRNVIKKKFQIPDVRSLSEVLRNSHPIMKAVESEYLNDLSSYNNKHAVPFSKGHTINGPPLECHILTESNNLSVELQYLKETLQTIFNQWPGIPIAILYNDIEKERLLDVCFTALSNLGKGVIQIETFYEQRNKLYPNQIICDSMRKVPSFEIPLVVTVATEYFHRYLMSTRARAKLIHIQLDTDFFYIEEMKEQYPNARFIIT